jgi:hypothetical protein
MPSYSTRPEWNDPTYTDVPYVHKVTVPTASGRTAVYYIRDAAARREIEKLIQSMTQGTRYIGVSTTPLVDGDTTNPIVITGETDPVTAINGDIVVVSKDAYTPAATQDKEFIYNGSTGKWDQFGDINLNDLGDFAFVDVGHASFTPNVTTTAGTVTSTGTATSNVSLAAPVVTPDSVNVTEVLTNTSVTAVGNLGVAVGTYAASVSYDASDENLIFTAMSPTPVTASNVTTKTTSVLQDVDVAAPVVTNGTFNVSVDTTTNVVTAVTPGPQDITVQPGPIPTP